MGQKLNNGNFSSFAQAFSTLLPGKKKKWKKHLALPNIRVFSKMDFEMLHKQIILFLRINSSEEDKW